MCPSLLGIENDEIDEKLGGILFFQVNSLCKLWKGLRAT